MPDGNNFIVRRCHVDWRDFAFFMKTDWGDLKTNYNWIRLIWYKLKPWIKFSLFLSRYRLCGRRRMIWSSRTLVPIWRTRLFHYKHAYKRTCWWCLASDHVSQSVHYVATLIDVNFHIITKAWFPLVIRIIIIGDSYDFSILGFLRLLRFLGQPGSHSS